jgi:glycyl-tRNA synthetase (class II)
MNWMHANIADCAETEREVIRLQTRVAELEAALTDVRRTEALSAHAYDLISAVLSATPEFELNQTDKTAGRYIRRETMEPGSQTPPP